MHKYVRAVAVPALQRVSGLIGFRVVPKATMSDDDPRFERIYRECAEYTVTSPERMYSLYAATEYLCRAGVEGDVVECGVFRGGSSKLVALTLSELGDETRQLYLYDTFTGMTEPTDLDRRLSDGSAAADTWKRHEHATHNDWAYAPLEAVQQVMWSTPYPKDSMHFVKGKVEETIPRVVPERIALLRLDTDWYESTYHEMVHLYPRLVSGGILIIDDYGSWAGARAAIDEYLTENGITLLLHRIDNEGRIAVKP